MHLLRVGVAAQTVATILAVTLAACIQSTVVPEDCDAAAVTREATLDGDGLTPATLDVCRGQQVTLEIVIERDGILHLHGYDDEAPASAVRGGETREISFSAVRSGQFPIELHTTDSPAEATVGVLIVHEP